MFRHALLLLSLTFPYAAAAQFPSGAEPPWPQVSSVDPGAGPSVGGTRITVHGWNIMPGAVVQIGGVEVPVVEGDSRSAVVVTPPGRPGRVSVTIVNPDGRKGTRGLAYRYDG